MGIYDVLKDAVSIAQKAGNTELLKGLFDAQQQALDLLNASREKDDEIQQLKDEISRLKSSMQIAGDVVEREGWYFLRGEVGDRKWPPICSRCWEVDMRLVHLHNVSINPNHGVGCPQCKSVFPDAPSRPK